VREIIYAWLRFIVVSRPMHIRDLRFDVKREILARFFRIFLFILHDDDVIVCWCTQLRYQKRDATVWSTSTSLESIFNEIIQRLISLKSSINYIILSLVCFYIVSYAASFVCFVRDVCGIIVHLMCAYVCIHLNWWHKQVFIFEFHVCDNNLRGGCWRISDGNKMIRKWNRQF
jgi:hypothetical protein